jgi:hypothetical protein
MKNDIVYKTLRKESKTARGFYKRMELIKSKAKGAKPAEKTEAKK